MRGLKATREVPEKHIYINFFGLIFTEYSYKKETAQKSFLCLYLCLKSLNSAQLVTIIHSTTCIPYIACIYL